jgi:hypothetical protein
VSRLMLFLPRTSLSVEDMGLPSLDRLGVTK